MLPFNVHFKLEHRRWDVDVGWNETKAPNKRFGSFVSGAELFDAAFFGIAAPEAGAMDAQQRLLMEGSHEALGHSLPRGLTGDAARAVSVAVGISYTEYHLNCAYMGMTAYTATSGSLRCAAARRGP